MKRVHVAVGVILNVANEVLITQRAVNAHQGGLWEFPGGKLELGESVEQALARELLEELGIVVGDMAPLVEIHHDYADKHVLLDVWLVTEFRGIAQGLEGQPLQWVAADTLDNYSFPAANKPIIEALSRHLATGGA